MRSVSARHAVPLITVAALWAVSLALPAIGVQGRVYDGLELLLQGWRGYAYGVYAWAANPVLLAALVAAGFKRELSAAVLAALAFVLAATSFIADDLLARRTGSDTIQIELLFGFYIWMLAALVLCLRSLTEALLSPGELRRRLRRRSSTNAGRSRD